jgi:hypothetical protein
MEDRAMTKGMLVRFKNPTKAEAGERFTVLEVRGDRVLVEDAASTMRIAPTFVYLISDLEGA